MKFLKLPIKKIKLQLAVTILNGLVLVACSSQPMYSEMDVLKAKNTGELVPLWTQMTGEYLLEKPSSERARNIKSYQAKVGLEIANEKEQELLNNLGRDLSQHDIATLNAAKAEAASIQSYNEAVYIALIAQIDQEIFLKEKILAEKRAEYALLGLQQAPRKVALLKEMSVIAGGDQAEALKLEQQAYIDSLFKDAQLNMNRQRYEDVVLIIEQLEIIQPDHLGLKSLEYALIEAEYEQQFWDALGAGDKNKSLSILKRLTTIPNYLQDNPDVLVIAKDLQALFVADADKKMETVQIISAYEDYSSANYIQSQLGTVKQYSLGEKKFIAVIEKKLSAAEQAGKKVLSYGYLSILDELQYDNLLVEEYAPAINNQMLELATIKILPRAFSAKEQASQSAVLFADVLAVKLQQSLKSRVVVLNSSKQSQLSEQVTASNSSAWFEITGELQKATVSLETVSESELKNVLVSYETVVNPAYEAWSALSSRKRKAATEPPSTIEEPVYKDIRIEREQLNKIADVAFSYRLLAQGQQAVIFFDSQANQLQAKGTNQLAVNEGEFSVAEQQAQLPSDEDLLMQLMNDAAMQLGEKIKPEIEGLESRYLQTGEIAYAQSDFNQAAAQLAYWHVLAQSQSKPMNFREGPSLEDKMRFSIMRWK